MSRRFLSENAQPPKEQAAWTASSPRSAANIHGSNRESAEAPGTPADEPNDTDHSRSRPWLDAYYDRKRQRTVHLTRAAVDELVKRHRDVTISAICELSRSLDPERKGIGPAAIRGNEEAYAYYREHSLSCLRYHRLQRGAHASGPMSPHSAESLAVSHPERIRADRDRSRARQRYRRLSKAALVERVLTAEEVLAHTLEELARVQYALVTQMQGARGGRGSV
jgi:hypothetical protein